MVKDVLIEADVPYIVIEKIIKDLETQCIDFKLKKDIKVEEFIAKKLPKKLLKIQFLHQNKPTKYKYTNFSLT